MDCCMKKLTILDGGMGRELKRIGAPFSQPQWSAQALIESPEYVYQAHQSFINAGAEIIIANSYACVPFHLGETLVVSLLVKRLRLHKNAQINHQTTLSSQAVFPPHLVAIALTYLKKSKANRSSKRY